MILSRVEALLPKEHPNNLNTECDEILALVVHYTANDRPTATDTNNAKYASRGYKRIGGHVYELDGKTPFAFGAANKYIDEDSVTTLIKTGFAAPNCGDRQLSYSNGNKGQTRIAKDVFGYRQNYKTISYEFCNNGNWLEVVENGIEEMSRDILIHGLDMDKLLILRHGDITGKNCPRVFMEFPEFFEILKQRIAARVVELKKEIGKIDLNTAEDEKELKSLLLTASEINESIAAVTLKIANKKAAAQSKNSIEDILKTVQQPNKNISKAYKVCVNELNFRKSPVISNNVIKKLNTGDIVYVVPGGANGFQKCYFKDQVGYVKESLGEEVYIKKV